MNDRKGATTKGRELHAQTSGLRLLGLRFDAERPGMEVRIISQYETLTKFHRGISDAEALVMVKMLNAGNDLCIVNDNEDVLLITRWEVTRIDGVGQLYSVCEKNYEAAKANNFQPID